MAAPPEAPEEAHRETRLAYRTLDDPPMPDIASEPYAPPNPPIETDAPSSTPTKTNAPAKSDVLPEDDARNKPGAPKLETSRDIKRFIEASPNPTNVRFCLGLLQKLDRWEKRGRSAQIGLEHLGSYFKVKVSELDFFSGHVGDGGQQFLKPLVVEQVTDRLRASVCPLVGRLPEPEYPNSANNMPSDFTQAWAAAETLGLPLLGCSNWNVYSVSNDCKFVHMERTDQWSCQYILSDDTKPHEVIFLSDDSYHGDDSLRFSEIWCITLRCYEQHLRAEFKDHITLISCWGRRFRIVQGFVDSGKMLRVRATPMSYSLAWYDPERITEFRALLGWLLSTPMGDTTRRYKDLA